MNKLLTTVIISIILLSGCKTTSEDLTYVTKKEEIRKEAYTKLPDNELIAILKNESNSTNKEKLPENHVIFNRCKINGKECYSFIIDIDKQGSPIITKNGDKILIRDFNDFYKISYVHSEYHSLLIREFSDGTHIALPNFVEEHHNYFILEKENKSIFKIYSENAIYVESYWNNET